MNWFRLWRIRRARPFSLLWWRMNRRRARMLALHLLEVRAGGWDED